ncbi:aminoglycoside phosphotransferase family protein [Ferrimonas sediminicola]|nr:phosphotransferase [Ferrimonas sediminicola]
MSDSRQAALQQWLNQLFTPPVEGVDLIFGDASHRRYFRFLHRGESYIAVDAPPELEDSTPFLTMTEAYERAGLPVPRVIAADLDLGFMCQSDLGDTHLQGRLSADSLSLWYGRALALLPRIARVTTRAGQSLPPYDEGFLRQELALLPEWFHGAHLGREEAQLQPWWPALCDRLVATALEQPQVGVHRDFHCRNLMVNGDALAVIDYQGALLGPVTYDPVSLLKDCYVKWSWDSLEPLLRTHFQRLLELGVIPADTGWQRFLRWYHLTGLQRHLKVLGIFARLSHRDGKHHYLTDLPRVLEYVIEAAGLYPETAPLASAALEWRQQLEERR